MNTRKQDEIKPGELRRIQEKCTKTKAKESKQKKMTPTDMLSYKPYQRQQATGA